MPLHDTPEDRDHRVIIKLIDCQHVHVTQEPGRDRVTSSTCHGTMTVYVTLGLRYDSLRHARNTSDKSRMCIIHE